MIRIGLVVAAALCLFAASASAASDPALSDAANAAFLAANAQKTGVVVRPSGLQYRILQNGFGKIPGPYDTVSVSYKGSLINGKVFDATEQGIPAQLEVDKLIVGWREALTIMRVGDRWQLVIPASLAYGSRGAGNGRVPPNQTLVFDLQLIDTAPPPPKEKGDDDSH
ncbi:MAG: FKBP-type peptidyl-prolyl cis-trans isomerase [Rhizomicrobium sp.]|jgi:FKBP-type peptidyl-prolyl cis-trans isomerase